MVPTRTSVRGVAAAAALALALLVLLLAGVEDARAQQPDAQTATVATDSCLRLRETPSLDAATLTCLADGAAVDVLAGTAEADGIAWQHVRADLLEGWVSADHLRFEAPPAIDGAAALDTPPQGGMTIGVADATSVEAIIAAQPFEVATLSIFDRASQAFRVHVVGAPAHVNTLGDGDFAADDVILVRRAGGLAVLGASMPPAVSSGTSGVAVAFAMPPRGGLTAGKAGTNDLDALVAAQPFAVETVAAWSVPAQRWLTYVVGAPAAASSLEERYLSPETPVFLRRSQTAPDPTPPVATPAPTPAPTSTPTPASAPSAGGGVTIESITYYFCQRGENPAGWGDGGGYCGVMRSGLTVYAGAAACAPDRLGQRFLIDGDPTGRTYTCEDTGGAVGSAHRDVWFHDSDEGYQWWLAVGGEAQVITLP